MVFIRQDKHAITSATYTAGAILILTYGLMFVAGIPLEIMGLGVTALHFPLSILLSIFILYYFADFKAWWKGTLMGVTAILLAVYISTFTVDFNCDSNDYHRQMIEFFTYQLWNPYLDPTGYADISVFARHYPKAAEWNEACIYAFTGQYGMTRSSLLILIFASTMLVADFAAGVTTSRFQRVILTIVAIANPIGICQSVTINVDAIPYYFILITIVLSLQIFQNRGVALNYCILGIVIILAANTKSLCFLYEIITILAICLGTVLFGNHQGIKDLQKRNLLRYMAFSAGCGVLGIVVWGFHPFITNWIHYGSPIFPHNSQSDEGLMFWAPEVMKGHNRFVNFFLSIYGDCPPGSQSVMAGFGRLFGILLPIVLIVMALDIIRRRKIGVYNYVNIIAIASCFIFEATWWARFICQLWIVVPSTLLILMTYRPPVVKIVKWAFIAIVLANTFYITKYVYLTAYLNRVKRESIYAECKGETIQLAHPNIVFLKELKDEGITDIEIVPLDSISPTDRMYLVGTMVWYPIIKGDADKRAAVQQRYDSIVYQLPPMGKLRHLLNLDSEE